MRRSISLLLLAAAALSAQTKKIVVMGDANLAKELQAVTTEAKVVAITRDNVMQQIADADAFVGGITPAEVRAGKNLKWVQS